MLAKILKKMNYPAASRRGITKELVLLFAASSGELTPK